MPESKFMAAPLKRAAGDLWRSWRHLHFTAAIYLTILALHSCAGKVRSKERPWHK